MRTDMHYGWLLKALHHHRHEWADEIAFASEMADECNDRNYPWAVDVPGLGRIPVVHTQSYYTSLWRRSRPRWRIWLVHFIPSAPGDPVVRVNEPLALRQFIADRINKIKTHVDAYVVGLAFHSLLDTGSHRTFTGFADPRNRTVYGIHPKSIIRGPIGHMMAPDGPDTVGARWERRKRGKDVDTFENRYDYAAVCFEACRLMDPAKGVRQREPYKIIAKATCDTDVGMYIARMTEFKRPATDDPRFWDFQMAAKIYYGALMHYLATGDMR